jgi:hypothetical protein
MHILIAYLLNIIDLLLTRFFISKGFVELNPLMKWAIDHNCDWFVKVVVAGMAFFVLYWYRDVKFTRIAGWAVFGLYAILTVWTITQFIIYLIYK